MVCRVSVHRPPIILVVRTPRRRRTFRTSLDLSSTSFGSTSSVTSKTLSGTSQCCTAAPICTHCCRFRRARGLLLGAKDTTYELWQLGTERHLLTTSQPKPLYTHLSRPGSVPVRSIAALGGIGLGHFHCFSIGYLRAAGVILASSFRSSRAHTRHTALDSVLAFVGLISL